MSLCEALDFISGRVNVKVYCLYKAAASSYSYSLLIRKVSALRHFSKAHAFFISGTYCSFGRLYLFCTLQGKPSIPVHSIARYIESCQSPRQHMCWVLWNSYDMNTSKVYWQLSYMSYAFKCSSRDAWYAGRALFTIVCESVSIDQTLGLIKHFLVTKTQVMFLHTALNIILLTRMTCMKALMHILLKCICKW